MNELERAVAAFVTEGDPEDEQAFDDLALRVFAHQYETIEVVRRLADRLRRTPDTVRGWRQIPAVPASAFKDETLFAHPEDAAVAVFESSGTSGRAKSRSLYTEAGLELMDYSVRVNAGQKLLPEGRASRILVLAPEPALAPHMIMAWGMERLIHHFGLPGSRFLIGRDGLDQRGLARDLRACTAEGIPVTLVGATFGFVHLCDTLAKEGARYYCPPGSRVMDAGGFKGRSRVVTREWLEQAIDDRFEIPAERCVNLLGMTELPSQLYDDVLDAPADRPRRKRGPHWTRTRVLDPATMQPVALGERGLLCHVDLCNVERPLVVQTDDIGLCDEHGWQVLGRASGSDARGCSLTVEEVLAQQANAAPRQKLAVVDDA